MNSALLWVALGLVIVLVGADVLVRGASRLALRWGLTPLVVGLTVVAFGTSAPELAVNAQAALMDRGAIGLGNVLGSNAFNTLFILGIVALIRPLHVQASLVRLEVPLVLVASVGAFALASDGMLTRWDGAFLLVGIVGYTAFLIGSAMGDNAAARRVAARFGEAGPEFGPARRFDDPGAPASDSTAPPPGPGADVGARQASAAVSALLVVGGLLLLVLGSRVLVDGAVRMAEAWGVSPLVIGLTVIAAGTSVPELATSVVAGARGHVDMAVGNVLGSNLFNLLFVLGGTAAVDPGGLEVPAGVLAFDFPLLVAIALATIPIFLSGLTITRREGAVFVLYYVGFVTYLVFEVTGNMLLDGYRRVLITIVLPLTVLVLVLSWLAAMSEDRDRRSGRRSGQST